MTTLSYDYPDSDNDRQKCREFIQNYRENGARKYYHLMVGAPSHSPHSSPTLNLRVAKYR